MATHLEGACGRSDVFKIAADKIVVDFNCNYSRFAPPNEEELEELAKSIQDHGQWQPVVVTRINGTAHLRAGFRRVLAIQHLNKRLVAENKEAFPVKCILCDGNTEDGFLINLEENLRRKSLSPMDIANVIQHLVNGYGKEAKEIAETFGTPNKPKSITWVSQHRQLLTLDNDVQKRIHDGEIPLATALLLASIEPQHRKEVLEKAEKTETTEKPEKPIGIVEKKTKKTVKIAATKAAIRAVTGKTITRSIKEVKETLIEFTTFSPLASYLVDYIEGKLLKEELQTQFEAVDSDLDLV